MPSKVSKTKVRMRMTRTTSAKMDGSSQPPAKTIKTSLENYHHLNRQRSQDGSNSDTNSKMSYEHHSSNHNHHSHYNHNTSSSQQNHHYHQQQPHHHHQQQQHIQNHPQNQSQHHNYNAHQLTSNNNPHVKEPTKIRHKKVHNLVQEAEADKSSQSSSSCDEKFCELDAPICKRYQIKSRLGKGAYGIVWQAIEKATGNTVAVKKIFDAFRNDTDAQRTYREIMFLREFGSHPNIIRLLKVHKASNNMDIYLVFPFMEHDLHRLIKNSPQLLKDSNTRQIFYQMLKAVKYLHSAEVIHRDLKPANILLDDYLNVKVGDFGLARSLSNPDDLMSEHNPVMTDYVATRWYRPPEILLSCPYYTKGVDMWSLGCILAECILLRPLFPGTSTIQQIETIMAHIAPPTAEEIEQLCAHNSQSTMVEAAMTYSRESLGDIFEKCDADIIDLIEKFLVFNPAKRITADEALAHSYLAKYRNPAQEICCNHAVTPPLNDYIQLPMGKYRSVIYDLIQVRKIRQQQQQQQSHPESPVTMMTNAPPLSIPLSKSQSHSQGTTTSVVVQSAPGVSHSTPNNLNDHIIRHQRSTTAAPVAHINNNNANSLGTSKIKMMSRKEKELRKNGNIQVQQSQQQVSRAISREKEMSEYSEKIVERSTIGPEGDGNGAQKVRTNNNSSNNNTNNSNYMQQIDNAGDRMTHPQQQQQQQHKTTTRKNNSTPNIPQVKRIPGPDGDGHNNNNNNNVNNNNSNNLPLPYLKLVSTAPGFQGKNPRLFDRSELSARQCRPVPSDLRGADKRLFEIYSNTADDLKEQIKAIEFQVRAKRENASSQWISDLSNNLNKATVSDCSSNNNQNNQYGNVLPGGRNRQRTEYQSSVNYSSSKHGGRGTIISSSYQHQSQTKLPEILQSWSQGHNKMYSHAGEQVVRPARRSTYFQDPPVSSIHSSNSNIGKFGGGRHHMGRLSQMSEFTREQQQQQHSDYSTTQQQQQERQGSSSYQHQHNPPQQYQRSTTPIEVIHARNKHYESYSQTHGTISASDLTDLRSNLSYLGKQ